MKTIEELKSMTTEDLARYAQELQEKVEKNRERFEILERHVGKLSQKAGYVATINIWYYCTIRQ